MKRLAALLSLALASASALFARVDFLLVPPTETVPGEPGLTLTLYLNNPTAFDEVVEFPTEMIADYASSTGRRQIDLHLANPDDRRRVVPAMSRVTIPLQLSSAIESTGGFVSLRLLSPETNVIMFEVSAPETSSAPAPAVAAAEPEPTPEPRTAIAPGHHLDLSTDLENMRRHISSYDPIYFAIGSRDRLNARFQFSFKYRVFEPATSGDPWFVHLGRNIHVAYTQTSIWDLETFSKPFYDTSYKPTLFVLHEFRPHPASNWSFTLQPGAQHESNGRGGGPAPATPGSGLASPTTVQRHPFETRSFNTLYFAVKSRWTRQTGLFFEATARASAYFQEDENPDIPRYRGYVELSLRGGYDRGFQLATHLRGHPSGHGSAEFNVTWPAIETPFLKMIMPHTLGGYAQIQYFNGYGESLLDYDVRRKDQLRFGLMIVR